MANVILKYKKNNDNEKLDQRKSPIYINKYYVTFFSPCKWSLSVTFCNTVVNSLLIISATKCGTMIQQFYFIETKNP